MHLARNIGLVFAIWLATTVFVLVSQNITRFLAPSAGGGEADWFGAPSSTVINVVLLSLWSFGVGRLCARWLAGHASQVLCWAAILAVPLWLFVLNGGVFLSNYSSLWWVTFMLVVLAVPLAAFSAGLRFAGHRHA
jgi:hypothetical protein